MTHLRVIHRPCGRPGYLLLMTVLIIGAIAISTTITLLLVSGAAEGSAYTLGQSMQAVENAQTCVERALQSLRTDLTYAGSETVALSSGNCVIRPVGGSGNEDRQICVQGIVGNTLRQFEVRVAAVYPQLRIASWLEVTSFSLCP